MIKVSVIVPNFNHAPYLKERLDSIFNQTFKNYEVILLDDASSDGSVEILAKYAAHPKVSHFIVNDNNSGKPFKQWKKGVELAKGEFIWIAESDDYCELTFLQKVLEIVNPETTLAYCASMNVNSQSEVLGVNNWASELNNNRWNSDFRNNGRDEIEYFLKFRNTIPNASAVIFRRKDILNDIPVNMRFCGDWFLWLKILKKGDIAYNQKALNYFRKHNTITSNTLDLNQEKKRFKEYMKIVRSQNLFFKRIINIKKYDWILHERCRKRDVFRGLSLRKLNFPLDIIIRYYLICKNG